MENDNLNVCAISRRNVLKIAAVGLCTATALNLAGALPVAAVSIGSDLQVQPNAFGGTMKVILGLVDK